MTEAEEMTGEFKTLRYLGIEAIINVLLKSPRGKTGVVLERLEVN